MFDRKMLKNFDTVLFLSVFVLACLSLVAVYAAVQKNVPGDPLRYIIMQGVAIGLGFVAMIIIAVMDYHVLGRSARYLFAICIGLLLLVHSPLGKVVNGAKSWLMIGPLQMEPAELAKPLMVVVLSVLIDRTKKLESFADLLLPLASVVVPVGLIVLEPNLGNALTMLVIVLALFWVAGVRPRHLGVLIGSAMLASPLIWYKLKPYQKDRLMVFLNPEKIDPAGQGYQLIQSKIAIGSGKLFGHGLLSGMQAQLGYLPEKQTDFIFATFSEAFGFVGASLVIILYLIIIYRILQIASQSRDRFGSLLATGVATVIAFSLLINVGMTMGIMPVAGIPLILMSYGGTSYLTALAMIGMVLSVGLRRNKILF